MHEAAPPSKVDLSVSLAGMTMKNPVMTGSGTSGYGPEYSPYLPIDSLGAFVTKAVTPQPRKGNPQPRTYETAAGMINAIGLANVGLERFCAEKVDYLSKLGIPVIVNVAGHDAEDYVTVCRRLDEVECISGLELNVSCPNVADGLDYGTQPDRLAELVSRVRKHVGRAKLIVKLSPNVTDITATARSAVNAGAEILSLVNTFSAMAINVETFRPMLANVTGGLSGPAIRPIAVCMVHRVYTQVAKPAGVPIIGMGGIMNWRDAAEFMLAGASAVAIGTGLFVDPTIPSRICKGLTEYLQRNRIASVMELVGKFRH